MLEIVVLSGKGGTGKTSLTGAFAHLSSRRVLCDLDVDAPDLHLLLNPEKTNTEEFYSGHEAKIEESLCDGCGLCKEVCRFDAVTEGDPVPKINPMKCEGCKVCVALCPADAISFSEKHCGQWYVSKTRLGSMVHAQLFPGEENSGRLVALLRQKAKALAKEQGVNVILSDGPPGIGCPVISSLSGASLAVIVTEPTPSGRHDLERIVGLCAHFHVPAGVIINKCDLNEEATKNMASLCEKGGLRFFGTLPHDPVITEAMIAGKTITEYGHNGFSDQVRKIWAAIERCF